MAISERQTTMSKRMKLIDSIDWEENRDKTLKDVEAGDDVYNFKYTRAYNTWPYEDKETNSPVCEIKLKSYRVVSLTDKGLHIYHPGSHHVNWSTRWVTYDTNKYHASPYQALKDFQRRKEYEIEHVERRLETVKSANQIAKHLIQAYSREEDDE